jgi:hypothetical protein
MSKGHSISCKVVMINGKVKHHRKGIIGNIAKYIYICVFIISKNASDTRQCFKRLVTGQLIIVEVKFSSFITKK